MRKDRKCHLDLLRIIAIWLVIFNHTAERGFSLFSIAWESNFRIVYLFVSVTCKIAVPIFWMVSGALLLGKEEDIQKLYKKRVLRFVFIIFFFSMLQYLYSIRTDISAFSISVFLKNLYTRGAGTTYWYLYAYLAYLMMLPFLRKMVVLMKSWDYIYLMLLSFIVVGILPTMQEIVWGGTVRYYPAFSIALVTSGNILYPLIGYYIENLAKEEINKKAFCLWLLAAVAGILVSCVMVSIQYSHIGEWNEIVANQEFLNCYIMLPAVAVVYGIKLWFKSHGFKEHTTYIIKRLGETVFSVMLLENIIREQTVWIYNMFYPYLRTFISTCIWVSCVWIIGILIGLILKKIPFIKMLV